VAGRLPEARRLAERLSYARPQDPRALTLLGRVMLAWPVFGRWKADSLFTRAGALDPENPEPFYYLGLVGIALRGDDGEWVARRGLSRVLALAPAYRDAWTLWSGLYRADVERRAGVAALARHAGEPAPDLWRSQLLIELRTYDEARPILDALIARAPDDPAPRALLAQALFEMGRDRDASAVYAAALARAAADTGAVLWRQVRSIASPAERRSFEQTPPEGRTAFYHRFWAFRRPDLRAGVDGRIGEHFRRLREAHERYRLLHPNSRWFHSPRRRAAPLFQAAVPACLRASVGPAEHLRLRLPATGVAAPMDTSETLNLEDQLDDRGRIFVRYGIPDERIACEVGSETWRYRFPGGFLQVTFARRTGGGDSAGDALVTPIAAGEADAARWLLATDRPSAPATLDFGHWTAAFRGATRWQTVLVILPDSAAALAALIDAAAQDVARDSTSSGAPLRLSAPAGRYLLAIDASRAGGTARVRTAVSLPSFAGDSLAVSSLLVSDRVVPADRDAMAAAAPRRLRLARDRPLRLYAEVYGLAAAGGRSRYTATYRFEPVGEHAKGRATTVRFRRGQPWSSVTVEALVVDPGRLVAGRYRVWLAVREEGGTGRAASASLEFEID
jgi:tetratricopeptide (TPR) repeat protein